jgi:hypothetical protein
VLGRRAREAELGVVDAARLDELEAGGAHDLLHAARGEAVVPWVHFSLHLLERARAAVGLRRRA